MEGDRAQENMERINFYVKKREKKELLKLVKRTGETMSHWLRHGIKLVLKEKSDDISDTRNRSIKG